MSASPKETLRFAISPFSFASTSGCGKTRRSGVGVVALYGAAEAGVAVSFIMP